MKFFIIRFSFFCISISLGGSVMAQSLPALFRSAKQEKQLFLRNLRAASGDSSLLQPLARHVETAVDRIQASIRGDETLSQLEKEKAARSLTFLIRELNRTLALRQLDIYDVPATIESYHRVLRAILLERPLLQLMKPLGERRSQLVAAAFTQYREHELLDDIVVFKRMANSPDFILNFLEGRPGFRFADSLLLEAAAYDPEKLTAYLRRSGLIQERVRTANNPYLRQILQLSGEKQASELLPFVKLLAEDRITGEEIVESRKDVLRYFQLMVNTMQDLVNRDESGALFVQPLRRGLKQKGLAFYVNEINNLHDLPENTRFASVKELRPQDLYYIITSCGDDLYTSSYLGLYKRLMGHFPQNADSLFDIVKHDNLRPFVRLAANYNVIADFLGRLSEEKRNETLTRFIYGIEADENTALEKAMDVADCFTAIAASPGISALFQSELRTNLERCLARKQYLGIRLYMILSDLLAVVVKEQGFESLWAILGDYNILRRRDLENDRGEIVELVLFYGDEDGVASFNNFLRYYGDGKKWKIEKNRNWVTIRSVPEPAVVIYANQPLDMEEELDLKAQDSLMAYLESQSQQPVVLMHRGHSYHLDKTLRRLSPSVRLAILGSCGSYNRAISIATINPDVQVIGSKKTGAKSINDPILNEINLDLLSGNDLMWPEIWNKLEKKLGREPAVLSLFAEYFPPGKNLGLFVLKLYNHYNRNAPPFI
ncbi:MAG TPA: hypothetical protein VEB63_03275 [Chitinophagaceae bacterium]|nr:hypothetical protein [Chitinophagaceae bacterium]